MLWRGVRLALANTLVTVPLDGLGWLIINSQSGGVSIEDQITVLRCALKALQEAFP
jgi:hypothetical protein